MKHLPDWVYLLHQRSPLSGLLFSCITPRCRGLRATMLLLGLTVFLPLYAQKALQWDKAIGGGLWDNLAWLQQTRDGGYILGGSSDSPISGDKTQASKGGLDYWVVKLDAAGNKVWDRTIGGDHRDELTALQQTQDGGFILGGWSESASSGDKTQANRGLCADFSCPTDYWVVKLDSAGHKVWDKTFGGNENDDLAALQQTSDGGFILGGWSQSGISGDKTQANRGLCPDSSCSTDYWVLKLDAAGNKVWDRTIGGDFWDDLKTLQQTRDGGYILGGTSWSSISGEKTGANRSAATDADYWLVKLDAAGNKQWDKTLGGHGLDFFSALHQTSDGGFILGGTSDSPISGDKTQASSGGIDYWVVKLDAAGSKAWDKTIGDEFVAYLSFLQQASDGGYVLGGTSNSPISADKTEASQGFDDYWVVKLDAAGNKLWDKTLGGSGYDELTALQQTSDGGIILGGYSYSDLSGDKTQANKGGSDFWLVKLAPFPKAGQVKSFTLIPTETRQPIRPLQEGDTINLAVLFPQQLNIRAYTLPDSVGSIRLELSGKQKKAQVANKAPYALSDDTGGDPNKGTPPPVGYTLTATPYARPNAKGEAGTPLTIHFTVIHQLPPPRLESFMLINTETEQPIRQLQDGGILNLAALPTLKLNIRADTYPAQVGSVRFELSGKQASTQLENKAPYALFGHIRGDYNKWTPPPGNYTLTARPYSQADGEGTAGTLLTIHFTVINEPPTLTNPAIAWDKTIGSSDDDYLNALQQTSDGGYILGGWSESASSGHKTAASKGSADGWVVKLDANGSKVWDKTFGGDQWDALTALQQTSDGGYILGGYAYSGISGDKTDTSRGSSDFWVLKLDAAGSRQWDKTFGGSGYDALTALQQTQDGGYILGGSAYSDLSGDKTEACRGSSDFWVLKLDAAGNKQWDKTLGGEGLDGLQALEQTSDGGYLVGGSSDSPRSGDKTDAGRGADDYWVLKLDAAGNQVWDKTFGGDKWDKLASLQQTSDGGYVLGGLSYSLISGDKTDTSRGSSDFWVLKLDTAGRKQWDKTFGGSAWDELYTLQQTRDGGYLLGGNSDSPIGGDKTESSRGSGDYWVLKLDAAGNQVWDKTIGGDSQDVLQSLQQTREGGIILGGGSASDLGGDKTEATQAAYDYWVVKLAPFRELRQVKSFTLINTETEQPIRTLQEGDTIHLAELPTRKLNIRADTHPAQVGSVKFALSGQQTRTHVENEVPYALFGHIRGDYNKWDPAPGSYTLTATPYAEPEAKGDAGTPLTIRFTVVGKPAAALAAKREQAPETAGTALAPGLALYPNPSSDGRLQVQLPGQVQGPLRYSLWSSGGRKLAEGTVPPQAGHLRAFDFSGQIRAASVYYLRIEAPGLRQVFRFIRR